MTPKDDPAIERVREIRHRISEECGHDPQNIVRYYIERQKKYQSKLIENVDQEDVRNESVKA